MVWDDKDEGEPRGQRERGGQRGWRRRGAKGTKQTICLVNFFGTFFGHLFKKNSHIFGFVSLALMNDDYDNWGSSQIF